MGFARRRSRIPIIAERAETPVLSQMRLQEVASTPNVSRALATRDTLIATTTPQTDAKQTSPRILITAEHVATFVLRALTLQHISMDQPVNPPHASQHASPTTQTATITSLTDAKLTPPLTLIVALAGTLVTPRREMPAHSTNLMEGSRSRMRRTRGAMEFNRFLPGKPCQTRTLAKTLLFRLIDIELQNHLRHPTSGTIPSSRRQFRRLCLDTRQRPPRERLRSYEQTGS